MKLKWDYELPEFKSDRHSDYDGNFFYSKGMIIFVYSVCKKICLIKFDENGNQILYREYEIPHHTPSLWQTVFYNKKTYLFFDDNVCLDTETLEILNCKISTFGGTEDWLKEARFLEEGPFDFNDFYIEHPTSFTYLCKNKSTNDLIWKLKLKGYLYSKIFKNINDLIFCTAEHGGGVYAVNEHSGEIRYYIDTKGTQYYVKINNEMFFYHLGEKGILLKINLLTGQTIEEFPLNQVTLDSPLQLLDNKWLLTLTFKKKRDNINIPVIRCIDINS